MAPLTCPPIMSPPNNSTFPLAGDARRDQLLVGGMVAALWVWHVWAVLVDQRLSGSDTFVLDMLSLVDAIRGEFVGMWWSNKGPKGPLPALLSLPLLFSTGLAPGAARLLSVICHGALVVQSFALARCVVGRRDAGLWAALVVATCPMLIGWSRLGYQEPLLAVITVGLVHLTVAASFFRLRPWLLFGLLCGLGLLTKLSMLVFVIVPGLWLTRAIVTRRVPLRIGLVGLGLAAVVALSVAAVWAVPNASEVVTNFTMSRHSAQPVWEKVRDYLVLPGVAPLLAAGLVGGALGLVRQKRNRSKYLVLLLFCVFSLVLFFVVFDRWSRYLVPVLPPLAVLAAGGLVTLVARWPRRARRPVSVGVTALLVGGAVACGAGWVDETFEFMREHGAGMLTPDRRPHTGFPRAVRAAVRPDEPLFLLRDSVLACHRTEGVENIWRHRGVSYPAGAIEQLKPTLARRGRVNLVIIRAVEGSGKDARHDRRLWNAPPGDTLLELERDIVLWLIERTDKKVHLRVTDPDGVTYEAVTIRSRG